MKSEAYKLVGLHLASYTKHQPRHAVIAAGAGVFFNYKINTKHSYAKINIL